MLKLITASMLVIGLSGASLAATKAMAPAMPVATDHGKILASPKGMALYTFDKDKGGKSECTLLCAAAWPPLMVHNGETAPKGWSMIKRNNGAEQWAYKGAPLYTYRLDLKAGDTSGDGVDGEWHLAKP